MDDPPATPGPHREVPAQPWPHMSKFMTLDVEASTDTTLTFTCELCKPKIKHISTSKTSNTNLRTHLRRLHKPTFDEIGLQQESKRKRARPSSNEPLPGGSTMEQARPMDKCVTSRQTGSAISQEKFNKLTVRFVVQGVHPLSIVERPDFKDYIHALVPGRQLLSRKTLVKIVEDQSGHMQRNLRTALSQQEHVATTTDAWSTNNRSFLGVTVHWIDQNTLQIQSAALACRRIIGRHTFEVLAGLLEGIHKDFKIQNKVSLTTTDNGANFAKAFQVFADVQKEVEGEREEGEEEDDSDVIFTELTNILSSEDEDYHLPPHRRCASHTLNLVATEDAEKAAENSEPFKRISRSTMAKCQALWSRQSRSAQASDTSHGILGTQLVVPNATHWNSTYCSLERLKRITAGGGDLDDVCGKLDVARFKQAEKTFISEYVTVVSPLAKALDILQSDKMAYYGVLLPTIAILIDKLQKIKRECQLQHCIPLADALIEGVKRRFGYVFENDKCLMATASHPMFKMEYIPEERKRDVAMHLREEVRRLQTPSSSTTADSDEEVAQSADDDITSFFPKKKDDKVDEVEAFEKSPDDSPQNAFKSLPRMREVFIKFNTGVPASAACERLFSVGGKDVFSAKRNRLSDRNFERLLMCRVNERFCPGI